LHIGRLVSDLRFPSVPNAFPAFPAFPAFSLSSATFAPLGESRRSARPSGATIGGQVGGPAIRFVGDETEEMRRAIRCVGA
jgi:hypothetical protein